jgi:hypothetical protein
MTSSAAWLRGDWMQTFSGRRFYPMNPRPTRSTRRHRPRAVAAVSLRRPRRPVLLGRRALRPHVEAVAPEHALAALLHDATEAYVCDVPRPLKAYLDAYRAIEDHVWAAIAIRFGLALELPAEVKQADTRILLNERAALMSRAERWPIDDTHEPLDVDDLGLGAGRRRARVWRRGSSSSRGSGHEDPRDRSRVGAVGLRRLERRDEPAASVRQDPERAAPRRAPPGRERRRRRGRDRGVPDLRDAGRPRGLPERPLVGPIRGGPRRQPARRLHPALDRPLDDLRLDEGEGRQRPRRDHRAVRRQGPGDRAQGVARAAPRDGGRRVVGARPGTDGSGSPRASSSRTTSRHSRSPSSPAAAPGRPTRPRSSSRRSSARRSRSSSSTRRAPGGACGRRPTARSPGCRS